MAEPVHNPDPSSDTYPKFKEETYTLFGGINSKVSSYLNTPHEVRDLLNLDFYVRGSWNKRPGSTMYAGTTLTGTIVGGVEFSRLNGASYIVVAANTNIYTVQPSQAPVAQITGLKNGFLTNFLTMSDRLLICNSDTFLKYDGTNNYLFSLPPGATASWGVTYAVGGSLTAGVTGVYVCAYGYVNERGFAGPISNGFTIAINGQTFNSITYYGMTQLSGNYGMTAIQLWRSTPGGVDLFGTTLAVIGATQITDTGFPLGTSLAIPHIWMTLAPRFLAIYNNQLFMAGFSQYPSRVYWSEIGEPEGIQPTFYAEFRTNDGDRITGLKPYGGALVVGKQKSLHRIIGDNPANFAIQEITTEYGSISQQAMVVFESLLWMIDQRGAIEYDGANIEYVSDPVDPFWIGMNYNSALDFSTAIHYKQLGQVWFSIPTFGAVTNTTTLVYDYGVKAWTRYDNLSPSTKFIAQGGLASRTVFYGGYSGGLFYMGQSFMSDNGVAFTCGIFTKWLSPGGQTTEKMYRRLWLDVDPIVGVTQNIGVNLYSNYVTTTVSYTGTIPATTFQSRVDFGISARTIAAQFSYSSATLPFKVNAYTFESRYQRSV